jgi:predicted dehydrogenase/dienelactone hydrolase
MISARDGAPGNAAVEDFSSVPVPPVAGRASNVRASNVRSSDVRSSAVRPSAIGGYEDWPGFMAAAPRYRAADTRSQELADTLGVPEAPARPAVRVDWEETNDGVTTSRLSWQLGFGPRTTAWFMRPAHAAGPLPGVLALHCHAGIKSSGAARLVDSPTAGSGSDPLRNRLYEGRPFATWLASQGFAVLAHDTFSWGSRGFDLGTPPGRTAAALNGRRALWREAGVQPSVAELYDAAAAAHEDTVAKAAGLLGTSFAGMVAHDDLAALNVLAGLPGVDDGRLGCAGFSGGGGRSLIVAALSPLIRSHVVTCMMTTFGSLFPAYLDAHSWLLQTPGLPRLGDWPDLSARSSADSLLVQYASADELFPDQGMHDADARLSALHPARRYTGSFWPGGHAFTRGMQEEAAAFLAAGLQGRPGVQDAAGVQAAAGLQARVSVQAAAAPAVPPAVPRIALVGVHGYGARHLDNLRRLEDRQLARLVAVADPRPPADGTLDSSVQVFGTLDELLAAGTAPDVVILATPIQTHAPLALAAIAAGADVYVEKPPMASLAQFEEVLAAAREAGKLVQVGFQSLGSDALPEIADLVESGALGRIRGIGATGAWLRSAGYFKRSRWAGRRSLDGTDVVDGVATNALAHAVATGLRIAGAAGVDDVGSVETDLYRAHNTESDDTSVIRVRTSAGRVLMCALTLCAAEQSPPSVTVFGTLGKAEFFYTEDRLVLETAQGTSTRTFGRTDLLENLLAARAAGNGTGGNGTGDGGADNNLARLLSPLSAAGAYMTVLEAVRTAEPPREIPADNIVWEGEGDDAHPVVAGIEAALRRAVLSQSTFAELGLPWARPEPANPVLAVDGRPVAWLQDGSRITPTSSPRPYLHPVTTLAGTVVTDHLPADHVWHLGAGVAIQDVAGVNFWGGRTYTRRAGGYVWQDDHGHIEITDTAESPGALDQALRWIGPDGTAVLSERRHWRYDAVGPSVWKLSMDFELSPAGPEPVALGSPGSNGRENGGYGGFFWRLPPTSGARVRTASAEGEDAVHGTVAPWLAWSGVFGTVGRPGHGKEATLVFLASRQAPDPWFVRLSGYPGVGLSLAWHEPLLATRDNPVRRTVTVLVADGILSTTDIAQLTESLGETT